MARVKIRKRGGPYKKSWYREISLGFRRVRKSGDSLMLTIPKIIAAKHEIRNGDEVQVIILKRVRMLADELTDDEIVMFEQFKKSRTKEKSDIESDIKALKDQRGKGKRINY